VDINGHHGLYTTCMAGLRPDQTFFTALCTTIPPRKVLHGSTETVFGGRKNARPNKKFFWQVKSMPSPSFYVLHLSETISRFYTTMAPLSSSRNDERFELSHEVGPNAIVKKGRLPNLSRGYLASVLIAVLQARLLTLRARI
jgi:hypothetical protein